MKKTLIILVTNLFATIHLSAQASTSIPSVEIKGKNDAVSFGVSIPAGEFSQTHFVGINADYSWAHHRFGKMSKQPKKLVGFIANGGIDYYLGKNETIAGFKYKYGGYTYLHAFGGAIYNFHKKNRLMNSSGQGSIMLTAGPGLSIYKGGSDLGFGINLSSCYYISEKIAISPGIMYIRHTEANALWVGMISVTCSF